MMWYEKILKALIPKVIQDYRDEARLYVDEVLFQIELLPISFEPVPAELLLGLLGAMYKKYYTLEDNSVSIADFSRTLLGLVLGTANRFGSAHIILQMNPHYSANGF